MVQRGIKGMVDSRAGRRKGPEAGRNRVTRTMEEHMGKTGVGDRCGAVECLGCQGEPGQ